MKMSLMICKASSRVMLSTEEDENVRAICRRPPVFMKAASRFMTMNTRIDSSISVWYLVGSFLTSRYRKTPSHKANRFNASKMKRSPRLSSCSNPSMARIRNSTIVPVHARRNLLDQSRQRISVAKIIINDQLQITKPIGGFCIRNGTRVKKASITDNPAERARKCRDDLACTSPSRFSCHILYRIHP